MHSSSLACAPPFQVAPLAGAHDALPALLGFGYASPSQTSNAQLATLAAASGGWLRPRFEPHHQGLDNAQHFATPPSHEASPLTCQHPTAPSRTTPGPLPVPASLSSPRDLALQAGN